MAVINWAVTSRWHIGHRHAGATVVTHWITEADAIGAEWLDCYLCAMTITDDFHADEWSRNWQIGELVTDALTHREAIRRFCQIVKERGVSGVLNAIELDYMASLREDLTKYAEGINPDGRDPVEPPRTTPKPEPKPTPLPKPNPIDKATWHKIVTALLGIWFLVGWFVPIPEAVKHGVRILLEMLAGS